MEALTQDVINKISAISNNIAGIIGTAEALFAAPEDRVVFRNITMGDFLDLPSHPGNPLLMKLEIAKMITKKLNLDICCDDYISDIESITEDDIIAAIELESSTDYTEDNIAHNIYGFSDDFFEDEEDSVIEFRESFYGCGEEDLAIDEFEDLLVD